ncbi:hypothetical protein EV643_113216 [Kribbella sp. VKM Ac-2527]|uniref:Uncharacterized protein n=1 Tax=Kribbella caucasensis TaxID=2512215 RepID=A0A4R6KB60_9ACTN|nr:hypothetical protein EV643_113216 [Kribbella sp. VKM Ac-2527]
MGVGRSEGESTSDWLALVGLGESYDPDDTVALVVAARNVLARLQPEPTERNSTLSW